MSLWLSLSLANVSRSEGAMCTLIKSTSNVVLRSTSLDCLAGVDYAVAAHKVCVDVDSSTACIICSQTITVVSVVNK